MGVFYALIFVLLLISVLIFRIKKIKIWKRILMVLGVWLMTFFGLAYYMTINFDKGFHRSRELVEISEEDRFSKEFSIGLDNFDKLKSVEKLKTIGKA
jgi:energy-coupling factor transporter transmembrane protein EcfT